MPPKRRRKRVKSHFPRLKSQVEEVYEEADGHQRCIDEFKRNLVNDTKWTGAPMTMRQMMRAVHDATDLLPVLCRIFAEYVQIYGCILVMGGESTELRAEVGEVLDCSDLIHNEWSQLSDLFVPAHLMSTPSPRIVQQTVDGERSKLLMVMDGDGCEFTMDTSHRLACYRRHTRHRYGAMTLGSPPVMSAGVPDNSVFGFGLVYLSDCKQTILFGGHRHERMGDPLADICSISRSDDSHTSIELGWTPCGILPQPLCYMAHCVIDGHSFAVAGGVVRCVYSEARIVDSNACFIMRCVHNGTTDCWSIQVLPNLPTALQGHSMVYVSGHLLVVGSPRRERITDPFYEYAFELNPLSKNALKWTTRLMKYHKTIRYHQMVVVQDRYVVKISGETEWGRATNDVECMDCHVPFETREWTSMKPLNLPRTLFAALSYRVD